MRALAMTAILLCAATAQANQDKPLAKAHYEEGMKLYNLGEYRRAREEFKLAYLSFADPVFLFDVGQCARMLGEPEEAARSYRAFLRERPETKNRPEVEKFIQEEDAEIQRRAANRPPTGTVGPVEAHPAAAAPSEAKDGKALATAPAAKGGTGTTAAPEKKPSRWWVGVVVAGAVVVVGAGVAVGVVLGTSGSHDAPDVMTSAGIKDVHF